MKLPVETITSRANPLVTLCASLAEKKYRTREGLFRFDGKKLLAEALAARLPLTAVLLRATDAAELCAAVAGECPADCRAVLLPDAVFDRLSEERAPEGVIAICRYLTDRHHTVDDGDIAQTVAALPAGRTLLLESVRDPGNLGTAVRSARAFGVENLVLSADCADLYHPRTVRAAMGALFSQRIYVTKDAAAFAAALRPRGRVFAAALDANAARLGRVRLETTDTLAVGNEGHGLSPALRAACTDTLFIPMQQGVESLNAGVAASVLLWEWYRT